ncbi:DUF4199 domain-containing protein [Marinilabilia rubra]|uniref:DUF4199 domain-containing protein n=1 Tax=Marinilabilia rubra TaxID=2162893 RepID=A0A2U2B4N4_9BACT|nr:DUF4199 domain-containing protein [Marinilabilia rubra]PWD98028.1 DUF4199 domain-containing protein [Marinilabilia rubra]
MNDLSTEERQKELKSLKSRFVLNQGAFMGVSLAGAYYLTHLLGMMDSFVQSILTWAIYIGFIHVSMVKYRDHFQDGLLSYGQGVWMGTRMGILAGIIVGAYLFLFMKVINPAYIDELIVQMQEAYLQLGLKEEEVAQMEGMFRLTANPVLMIISGVLGAGFSAFIFSLIIAIFQRRKGDPFSDAMKNIE